MKKLFAFLILVALCVMGISTFNVHGQDPGHNPSLRATDAVSLDDGRADERYIVEFRRFAGASRAVRAAGGQVVRELPQYSAVAARLPSAALQGLSRNPNVSYIEADPRRYPMSSSDVTLPSGEVVPYGIQLVQADQLTPGNPTDASAGNRKICIIDSGYYMNHSDLPSSNVTASPDPGTGDPFTDNDGHGTHVAGTIAAIGGNSQGVVGVLPNSRINLHIVKVFGDDGTWAYSSDLISALDKCRQAGSNVVSMSLGGSFKNRFEERAFNDAEAAGVLSVAAAGNDGSTRRSYPASYNSVVSVGALDHNKVVAGFSQKNDQVELAAPGVTVLSTVPYLDTNTLTAGGVTYRGNHIEFSARSVGVSGQLANGGLCTASNSSWSGKVVLCERGTNSFLDKVSAVQTSGGVAAAIYNNEPGNFFGTLGSGNSSSIPAISLSQADGQALVASQIGLSSTVVSTFQKPASGYDYFDGTSMATPHVSAVAALVWSHNTAWTNAQIRQALQSTAEDLGPSGRDTSYGFGLVRAKAALAQLQGGGGGGCIDADGDGFCSDVDCNDSDPKVFPGANDTKGKNGRDGIDNDCNGIIDG